MRHLIMPLLAAGVTVLSTAPANIEPAISPGENPIAIAGSCTHPLFGGQRFGTGDQPLSVTWCDLNSDGKLDLVVANRISDDLSVLLGNGDNIFTVEVCYSRGNDPGPVAARDLDNDGNIDLAVANGITDDVSILLGNGDGTFESAQNQERTSSTKTFFAENIGETADKRNKHHQQLLVGYKRAEILLDPILEDQPSNANTTDREIYTIKVRAHSLLAKLLGEVKTEAKTGTGQKADAGITVAQWSASGGVPFDHILMRRLP